MHAHNKFRKAVIFAGVIILLQSCSYSVIIGNKRGVGEPDPLNETSGAFHALELNPVDTVVHVGLLNDVIAYNTGCPTGLYAIKYKITFWDIMRNTFAFGKRKHVRITYVCLTTPN